MSETRRKSKFWKRSQSGQSIVILALGFLALLAFVGIVTDVSLMFVRYSTLRRAVDAAAIAAAGQMQRSVDESVVDIPSTPINEREAAIQADSYANMSLAARNFIELYGLDPDNVIVETCYSQNVRLMDPRFPDMTGEEAAAAGIDDWLPSRPVDSNEVPFYLYNASGEIDRQTAPDYGINRDAIRDERLDYEELCTPRELKLVRVTAQVDSPTVFLRLFGFRTVTLQESAISQTAVLDVVLMLDVSESMLEQTSYESYQVEGYWHRYFPPQLAYNPSPGSASARTWEDYLHRTQADILTNVYGGNAIFAADPTLYARLPSDAPTNPDEINIIRRDCQVQFYPSSGDHRFRVSAEVLADYDEVGFNTAQFVSGYSHGFVPAVDYYGCCNDPNGDGSFADLVCQPFRDVRNAAENFLERLDFTRGDRVAFATFDQQAYLMDPDGADGEYQVAFMESLDDIPLEGAPAVPESSRRTGALTVLQDRVGVRAEPTYYADSDGDGDWDGYQLGATILPFSDYAEDGTCLSGACAYYENTDTYNLRQSPVRGSCFVDGASNDPRFSEYDFQEIAEDTFTTRYTVNFRDNTPLDEVITPFTLPDWLSADTASQRYKSYEYAAGCRGTNIAGSLQSASFAFGEYGRVDGAVWIMVLLSDGAAGATDPVLRLPEPDDGSPPTRATGARLYNTPSVVNDPFAAAPDYEIYGFAPAGLAGATYGGYGLCPFGTWQYPGELTADFSFPFCSDDHAETRTFCYPPPPPDDTRVLQPSNRPINLQVNGLGVQSVPPDRDDYIVYTDAYVDLNTEMNPNALPCELIYDVDDYTRDWADFIALDDFNGGSESSTIETRLPIIFTIGFGIYDPEHPDPIPDDLGEEMLRYIADVGDNSQLDSDYWQELMGSRIPTWDIDGFGGRGPCEIPSAPPGGWDPLPDGQSCGNYFNAPDAQRLNEVFDQIASRMFTRLAQ